MLLSELLVFSAPADQVLSRFFRENRQFGQQDRAFLAETVYQVLRRRRSLEAAADSGNPRELTIAALVRLQGISGRSLDDVLDESGRALVTKVRASRSEDCSAAIQAELPDWLWQRLVDQQGSGEAMRIARSLYEAAPLDLRVNLARITREAALSTLSAEGYEAAATPYSPAGIRMMGRPPINRHALFTSGGVEVQDEGSQLLAYLVAPRRGEMVVDFCAGAGGKTLAMSMLMRGTGRMYAFDVSSRRLAALAPRAARAGISNVHSVVLSGEGDVRAKRLAGKIDRVLVDAPCSGFGTLRRNPDLKWRHDESAIEELALKQSKILKAASNLLKPKGRLVYATCSLLAEENEAVVNRFVDEHPEFDVLDCGELMTEQRVEGLAGRWLRLWPHLHATDGFFAAAFQRR